MITFANNGPLDIDLITTLGVNVKDSPAIGYFGTGLKYAIAVLLREKCQIKIRTLTEGQPIWYSFSTVEKTIRGKAFQFIQLTSGQNLYHGTIQTLGFTTELGKNWSLEEAYRELWSNCMDEKGEVYEGPWLRAAPPFDTEIIVDGLDAVHKQRDKFILPASREPLFATPDVEVYLGQSNCVFYRGISAMKLPLPSKYTYNVLCKQDLTEDRTFRSGWYLSYTFAETWTSPKAAPWVDDALCASMNYEKEFIYSNILDEAFIGRCKTLFRTHLVELNKTAAMLAQKFLSASEQDLWEVPATPRQEESLAIAKRACAIAGVSLQRYPIRLSTDLGQGVLGRASRGAIWLSTTAFDRGQVCLIGTILEEWLHLETGYGDETRSFQNAIFDLLGKVLLKQVESPYQPILLDQQALAQPAPVTLAPDSNDDIPF